MFILLADLEQDLSTDLWIHKCRGFGDATHNIETYVCAAYYVMPTTATVGYGDITPVTTIERICGMALMFCGVLSFTFVSGTLASILSANDSKEALLQERVNQLSKLRMQYPVSEALIKNIRHALNVDANKTDDYLDDVAKDLPAGLKMELMMIVYQT